MRENRLLIILILERPKAPQLLGQSTHKKVAMANVTDPLAKAIHGTNPQNLIEYITRQRIYDSQYWKEECFGLTAEGVGIMVVTCLFFVSKRCNILFFGFK